MKSNTQLISDNGQRQQPENGLTVPEKINNHESLITRIRDGILSVINWPFKKAIDGMMRTLKKLGLNSEERMIIEDSEQNKYIPALRDSALGAVLATPGILTMASTGKIEFVLAIISSVTGIAWFAISLKEVKSKFADFGVELTRDMLKAFLTTTLIIGIMAGGSVASVPIQWVLQMLQESGIDLKEILSSPEFQAAAQITTLGVGVNIVRNLVKATIKFDANDAMLTGSTDAAKTYFNRAISSLRNTANLLKEAHSLEAANFQIHLGFTKVYQSLCKIDGVEEEEIFSKDELNYFSKNIDAEQANFDIKLLPILERLIHLFQKFAEAGKDETIKIDINIALISIAELKRRYEGNKTPHQELADSVIANSMEIIADLIEQYGENLSEEIV